MSAVKLNLHQLAFNFFQEFARHEYCLKAVGLYRNKSPNKKIRAEADWSGYAREKEIQALFNGADSGRFEAAHKFYKLNPPNKQVVLAGRLEWDDTLPDSQSDAELILLLICRTRNNLFHGGKFNGKFFQPQRSRDLLAHGLIILEACRKSHPRIGEAYDGIMEDK